MYVYISIWTDDQADVDAIVAHHLNQGHWVSLDGVCDLSDDDTAADIDRIVKRAAAPTSPKPFIDARTVTAEPLQPYLGLPPYMHRQSAINIAPCTTCKSGVGKACRTAGGDSYGDGFIHAARARAYDQALSKAV